MLTQNALQGFRQYTERTLAYAKYKIGSNSYKVLIDKVEIISNTKLAVFIVISPHMQNDIIIAGVQLFDNNNQLWLEKTENIAIKPVQEGVLYKFTFEFKEV